METSNKTIVTIETLIKAPLEKVWECWIEPKHITEWYFASDDWHAPHAENNLLVGQAFKITMAAKDGSASFDFEGVYSKIEPLKQIHYGLADGRQVKISFIAQGDEIKVVESFDTENDNPVEMQRAGWQAILNNFKKHVETQ